MRLTLFAALTLATPAFAQDRVPSHCFAVAQGVERVMQARFGETLAADTVRIHYIGHASFAIEAGGLSAVTDYTGFTGSRDIVPDVVTMNNAHGTHWTASPDPRIPHALQGWADERGPAVHDLDLGAMLVRNVPTDVRDRYGDGVRRGGNSIFVFEAGGLCIGHMGHLHHAPDDAQYAAIGRLDVVMVPVDGGYTMATSEMAQVVKRLRSSVVIPMHWFSGASLQVFLGDLDGAFDVVETGGPEITLTQRTLPRSPTILVLNPASID